MKHQDDPTALSPRRSRSTSATRRLPADRREQGARDDAGRHPDRSDPGRGDFVSANPGAPTCSFSAPNVVCTLGALKPGQTVVVLVTATVTGPNPPTATSTYTNTATVTSETSPEARIELTPADNTASATVTAAAADLAITKTAGPTPSASASS